MDGFERKTLVDRWVQEKKILKIFYPLPFRGVFLRVDFFLRSVKMFNHVCIVLLNLGVNIRISNDILMFNKHFSVLLFDVPAAGKNF